MSKQSIPAGRAESTQRAELSLERLLEWVPRHDTKASVLFGIQAGMLGTIAASFTTPISLSVSHSYLLVITVCCLGMSIIFNCLGMFPHIRGPKKSLLFFCSIAGRSYREFQKQWLQQSNEDYLTDLLQQIHVNALIAEKKYLWLARAYILTATATIPWALIIYLLHK